MSTAKWGKLNINDKLSKCLPQLPAWARLHQRLTCCNTPGLPDVKWKTVLSDAGNMADILEDCHL